MISHIKHMSQHNSSEVDKQFVWNQFSQKSNFHIWNKNQLDIILLITRVKEEVVKNKVECEKIFLKAFIPLLAERILLDDDWFGLCLMSNQPL